MQPHPGCIRRIVDIDLPRPRNRSAADFITLRDDVLRDFAELEPAAITPITEPVTASAVAFAI
jgi:ABC-type nitrate/sulfonate/bicarbonate transport system ATPase subunit